MKSWIASQRERIQRDYFTFLKFPTIGVNPKCADAMHACSQWLSKQIESAGLRSELIPTSRFPLVYAEAGEGPHTLLIYGHYDVQPVDPLDQWLSPPFEPTIRDGKVFARGALDDKGQVWYAVEALRMLKGKLPIRVKLLIEGGEEAGSEGLYEALPRIAPRLKTDSLLVVDFDLLDAQTPAISLGARGLTTMEIRLTGSNIDLHSGMHGGLAYNPNRALAELIATLWDKEGRVAVPGFYDEVEEMKPDGLTFRFDEETYRRQFAIDRLGGEQTRTLLERNWLRPTLEINGLSGGYAGPGFKTVIPAQATAKLSCRLVPHQDPDTIGKKVKAHLEKQTPRGMQLEVTLDHGGRPFRGRADSPLARALSDAYHEVMGTKAARILSGGSIPVIADLLRYSGGDVVGMGFGLAEDNIHAPNECFSLDRLEKGIETLALTIQNLARTR